MFCASSSFYFIFSNGKVWGFIRTSFGWRNEWKGSSLTQPVDTVTCKSLILESGGWIQVCNITISPRVTPQAKANSLWSSFDQTSAYMCRASPYPDLSFDLFLKKVWRIYSSLPHVCFLVSTPRSRLLIIKSAKPFPECLFWAMSSDTGKKRQSAFGNQGFKLAAGAFWSGSVAVCLAVSRVFTALCLGKKDLYELVYIKILPKSSCC